MAKKTATIREVSRGSTSFALQFVLAGKYWDAQARDYLYSVSKLDPCEEIAVFTKAGYSDAEIIAVYDALQDSHSATGYGTVTLPRPVKVSFDLRGA